MFFSVLSLTAFCSQSSSKLTQSIVRDHMVSHYKKVYSAKGGIHGKHDVHQDDLPDCSFLLLSQISWFQGYTDIILLYVCFLILCPTAAIDTSAPKSMTLSIKCESNSIIQPSIHPSSKKCPSVLYLNFLLLVVVEACKGNCFRLMFANLFPGCRQ